MDNEFIKNLKIKIDEDRLAAQIESIFNGSFESRDNIKICNETPIELQSIGCEKLPVFYTVKHFNDAIKSKDKHSHKHGLDISLIKKIPTLIYNPVMIFDSTTKQDSIIIVTEEFDSDMLPIVISLKPNGTAVYQLNEVDSNFLTSIYGRNHFINFVNNSLINDSLLYINKIKSQALLNGLGLQSSASIQLPNSNGIIHPSRNIVNTRNIEEIKKFKEKTNKCFNLINGKYSKDFETFAMDLCRKIADNYFPGDVEILNAAVVGRRSRGFENRFSDIDVALSYKGTTSEEKFGNYISKHKIIPFGIKMNIVPIREQKQGIFVDYLKKREKQLQEERTSILKEKYCIEDKPKLCLTNEPISFELYNIIDKLNRGEFVDINEIKSTKEIRLAESFIDDGSQSIDKEDRVEFDLSIVNQLNDKIKSVTIDKHGKVGYNGIVEKGNRLDIVIGLPGAGKSSAISNIISYNYKSRIIDSDEAKKMIPEYNDGWGASIVHRESQIIERFQFNEAVEKGENIVLSKVGSDACKLEKYIDDAKAKGYVVNIHYLELDRNKAIARVLNRFISEGRYIALDVINKYDNPVDGCKIEKTYETLKNDSRINEFSRWNNDVPKGDSPRLVEGKGDSVFIKHHLDNKKI